MPLEIVYAQGSDGAFERIHRWFIIPDGTLRQSRIQAQTTKTVPSSALADQNLRLKKIRAEALAPARIAKSTDSLVMPSDVCGTSGARTQARDRLASKFPVQE